jgi:DNA polymerase III alpha subunit
MITYANLNTKSHYSAGLAVGTTTEIIKKAMEKKLHGLALTDRNTASGLIDFYNKAKELKFKAALGIEIFYYDNANTLQKIVLIAINQEGYFNLCHLITNSWNNVHLFNTPCVSLYDLNEYSQYLYCLSSSFAQRKDLKSIYKDKLIFQIFLDYQNNENNFNILKSSEKYIISCDAFIPDWDFKELQDVMLSNSKSATDTDKAIDAKPILSAIEIMQYWKTNMPYMTIEQLAKAFQLSVSILDECSKIELKFRDQVVNYPHLLHPLNHDGCSKEELVYRIAKDYGRFPIDNSIYKDRFEYEMDAITNNGRVNLIDYFLVLEDLCRWCRENGITVGPGRGSGAGALVNYCLKITHLDPIVYNLLFERFISKGRIINGNMPDVDLDFSEQEPVREYLIEKYGSDRVYRIGTFQTLKTLGSIKDICKSMQDKYPELDFVTVNNVTKTFGDKDIEESEAEFFERVLEENEVAQTFFQKYPDVLSKVERLVGYNRQAGIHPCFNGNMKILTDIGYKTFYELENKSAMILTPSGWRNAVFFKNGIKQTYKHIIARSHLSTRGYIEIICTKDHIFKSDNDSDSELYKKKILSNHNCNELSLNHFLLGWIWNDGYFNKNANRFIACITPEKDKEFFKIFPEDNFQLKQKKYAYTFKHEFNQIFDNLGYDYNKTTTKQFPIQWNTWTIIEKFSWLKGMFSANGFIVRKKFGIKLTSRKLIIDMITALNELGITTTTNFNDQPSIEWKSKAASYFYLTQHGNNTFIKAIGFVQDYKNNNILKDNRYIAQKIIKHNIEPVFDFTVIDGDPYGLVEGFWAHNCGLALCQDNVEDFAPLRSYKGTKVLDINAGACEQSGILKYDILGLRTLKYIQATCDLVGIKDIYSIPLDDRLTHNKFAEGDTNGVFQFNSDVAIGILTMIPKNKMSLDVESLTTSCGRPGPMRNGQHIEFAKRVSGDRLATAPHPALEEELKSTFGIMIYQENVMKTSQILGGFSLAEADDIRRAMGKKKASVLAPYKSRFIDNCQLKFPETKDKYLDEKNPSSTISKAEYIWNLMATFSGYGFCKAHSVAYTLIGYQCQYLKTHHHLEWWTACLMHAKSDKIQSYYQDAMQYCIDPDINKSQENYKIIDGKIQMPLTSIKGLGPKASQDIYYLRPFTSMQDCLTRVNKRAVNKKVALQLIYAGCFDSLHPEGKQHLVNEYFRFRGEKAPEELKTLTRNQLTDFRIKALSYLQRDLYEIFADIFSEPLTQYENIVMTNEPIHILGKVDSLKKKKTKNGNDFGDLMISNNGEVLKIRMWEDELKCYKENLKEKNELRLKCKVSEYNNQVQLTLISCKILGV